MNHTPMFSYKHTFMHIVTIAYFTLLSSPGFTQTHVVSHFFDHDVKMYSTEIVPSTEHESVMAGTVFESIESYENKVHFLHIDANGSIVTSNIYDDPDYTDERAVDIVPAEIEGDTRYIITCLVRPNPNIIPNKKDRIKILIVNLDGSIYAEDMVYETEARGLYPMHSIMHNGYLFICGYQTELNYALGESPMTTGYNERVAFVIKYNPSNMSIVNNVSIDHQYSSSLLYNTNPQYYYPDKDFDVAMRLVPLADGSDNIFVTGSVNGVTGIGGIQQQVSATMSIVIDDNLNIVLNKSFKQASPLKNRYSFDEYGIGLAQDTTNNPVKNYVIGNSFGMYDAVSGGSSGFIITYVDNLFDIDTTALCRYEHYHQEESPALQTIETYTGSSDWSFGIGGVVSAFVGNSCYKGGTYPEAGNVAPYLAKIVPTVVSGAITIAIPNWTTYVCQTGTGIPGTMPNSYYNMGDEFSHIHFNPTFAARASINSDVLLSAPKLNGFWSYGTLGMKSIRAKYDDLTVSTCDSGYQQLTQGCTQGDYSEYHYVEDIGTLYPSFHPVSVIPTYSSLNINNEMPMSSADIYAYSDIPCDVNPPDQVFRTASIENAEYSIEVFPNPATDEVNVGIKGVDEKSIVIIELYNIQGQIISNAFKGYSYQIRPINISHLPPGLYMIKIWVDGETTKIQKLIKN